MSDPKPEFPVPMVVEPVAVPPASPRAPLVPERSDFREEDQPVATKVEAFLAKALAATAGPKCAAQALVPWMCDMLQSKRSLKAYGRDLVDFVRHNEHHLTRVRQAPPSFHHWNTELRQSCADQTKGWTSRCGFGDDAVSVRGCGLRFALSRLKYRWRGSSSGQSQSCPDWMGPPSNKAETAMTKSEQTPLRTAGPSRRQALIAAFTLAAIGVHLVLRWRVPSAVTLSSIPLHQLPLLATLLFGGVPLVFDLLRKLFQREFGSDLLAGISILTSFVLGEYLAGALVVLMLSGGAALEAYAVRSASSVLEALARRMPSLAHRRQDGQVVDVDLGEVAIGDTLVVFPHEICPVDGTVVEGHGVMDESYLTGEPYRMSKIPGSAVLSGAINGETALTVRADKLAMDSRYAKIMEVMQASEQRRPRLRRLGDQLGAFYTPLAVTIALLAWAVSGEVVRFLAVLVVATPCPLLIAIPVAILGAISLAARRGIIIKDPVVLEKIDTCRTAIFDKTGTLTYGQPTLTEVVPWPGFTEEAVLTLVASLERYSKHPLAGAILEAARGKGMTLQDASEVREPPGQGLRGMVAGRRIQVTNRKQLMAQKPQLEKELPPLRGGMECVIAIDDRYAATLRFRDQPRAEGASFVHHLRPKHLFDRVLIVSGDRESEVRYLAEQVGIDEVHAGQTPEQKVAIVRAETQRANTVFLGDGINDAPALTAATVGIAFGQNSDIAAEAAGAVILDTSLQKVDEFLHISRRLRSILLQSALGGMTLSLVGMGIAAAGYLPPVAGAILQEVIDVLAVVNALRVAFPPKTLTDY